MVVMLGCIISIPCTFYNISSQPIYCPISLSRVALLGAHMAPPSVEQAPRITVTCVGYRPLLYTKTKSVNMHEWRMTWYVPLWV
jgi:hypothetical protein